MSLLAQIVIAGLIFLAGVAGGIRWHAGQDAIAANLQREQAAKELGQRLQRVDTASVGHEADRRRIQTEFVTVTEEVERVVEKTVYRDVCLDDDGLRALRSAIHGPDPASEPARVVPGPGGTP
jgi:hypothetical protein